MRPCDESLKKTFKLAKNMLDLADEGDRVREDAGCGVLYGVLRDSAFKIKLLAEAEKDAHVKKGWWKQKEEKMEKKVLNAMKKTGKPVRPGEIAKMIGEDSKEVSKTISELKKKGKVISPKRCYYSLGNK